MSTFIGIDFSGGARPWRRSVSHPTVWLAIVQDGGDGLRLIELTPVQSLQGNEMPFDRLVKLLAAGDFEAAAIDAPFSLPSAHMPSGGHLELLRRVAALPDGPDRPFPIGESIIELGEAVAVKDRAKPLLADREGLGVKRREYALDDVEWTTRRCTFRGRMPPLAGTIRTALLAVGNIPAWHSC